MKIERNADGSAKIAMSTEEIESFKASVERMTASFVSAAPVLQRLINGLEESSAAEICQRLDPAFSGPPIEYRGERWSASTPAALRALRNRDPGEPGHALGSRGNHESAFAQDFEVAGGE